jgi:hypothetical protein
MSGAMGESRSAKLRVMSEISPGQLRTLKSFLGKLALDDPSLFTSTKGSIFSILMRLQGVGVTLSYDVHEPDANGVYRFSLELNVPKGFRSKSCLK